MSIIWRIGGVALVAGLALFLISLLLKLVLVAAATALVVGVAVKRLTGRGIGQLGRGNWAHSEIISIDNPAYRSVGTQGRFDRVIPIN